MAPKTAPKADRLKTRSLGNNLVTEASLRDMIQHSYIITGAVRAPKPYEVVAHPEDDEVMVHHQPEIVTVLTPEGTEADAETQYGRYKFTYKDLVSRPVTAYKNKWPVDWMSHWFYHKITLDSETRSHPLMTDRIRNLEETLHLVVEETEDHVRVVDLLRRSKVFSTRDIVEEYVAC
ncbi:hypothetical protein C2845_PM01G44030 [Panicum miliaceum]|uniref:Uncharacterized protein n=1 Tax=Panicum miliaceum TaxID=4540 RepID=A0A3L6TJG2_PANMI|nr:hypothetical protein C2845_PM01G44030 [Panicum miliaceum]